MPKFLPKTARKSSGFTLARSAGFTLVELLVVVSIIAVLSVMGIVVLGNVQKGARDARRKADIQAISKALEVNYNDASGQYVPLTGAMFAGGAVPQDPTSPGNLICAGGGTICKYCFSTTVKACVLQPVLAAGQQAAGATTYIVCANLESGTGVTDPASYYCLSSQR